MWFKRIRTHGIYDTKTNNYEKGYESESNWKHEFCSSWTLIKTGGKDEYSLFVNLPRNVNECYIMINIMRILSVLSNH